MARPTAQPAAPLDLDASLAGLADVIDVIAIAVGRHDLAALTAANARATEIQASLALQIAALDPTERVRPTGQITNLLARLRTGVRRNAFLIERAWAIDAATTRLLLSLGRNPSEPFAGAYVPVPAANIERRA